LRKNVYAGPKSARNILTNLSPNPARPEKPGTTCNTDYNKKSRTREWQIKLAAKCKEPWCTANENW